MSTCPSLERVRERSTTDKDNVGLQTYSHFPPMSDSPFLHSSSAWVPNTESQGDSGAGIEVFRPRSSIILSHSLIRITIIRLSASSATPRFGQVLPSRRRWVVMRKTIYEPAGVLYSYISISVNEHFQCCTHVMFLQRIFFLLVEHIGLRQTTRSSSLSR